MRLPRFLSTCFAICMAATPALAEEGKFAVSVAGFGAGTIAYRGSEEAGRYRASGQVASTGLARGLYPTNISVGVNGRVDGNRYSPSAYTEKNVKKGKTKTGTFRYSNGVPPPSPRTRRTRTENPITQIRRRSERHRRSDDSGLRHFAGSPRRSGLQSRYLAL